MGRPLKHDIFHISSFWKSKILLTLPGIKIVQVLKLVQFKNVDSWKLWKFGNWKVNILKSPKYEIISDVLLSQTYFRTSSDSLMYFLKFRYLQIDRAFPGFVVNKTNFKLWILVFRNLKNQKIQSLSSPKYEHISNVLLNQKYFWNTIDFWWLILKLWYLQFDRAFPVCS